MGVWLLMCLVFAFRWFLMFFGVFGLFEGVFFSVARWTHQRRWVTALRLRGNYAVAQTALEINGLLLLGSLVRVADEEWSSLRGAFYFFSFYRS